MSSTILFALGCGLLGVIYAIATAMWVSKQDAGNTKMQEISNAVKEGAYAFLAREYKTVAVVAVLLVILILVAGLGTWTAIGFVIGTVGSALASPVRCPVRTGVRRPCKVDPFRGLLLARIEQYPELTARKLFSWLCERGYDGGYTRVVDAVRELRPALTRPEFTHVYAPGEYAQVDWGTWKAVPVRGGVRKLQFFSMVLCHSRLLYVELAWSQQMEWWLTCHRNAFRFFGGVPAFVTVDRCRTAVKGVDASGKPLINDHYAAFASHYGFTPDPCHAYCPDEKGTVENVVKYIRLFSRISG